MKSILNNTPAAPNEVSEIVNTIQNDNPVKSLSRIMRIYTQGHLYLNQWKELRVELECLKRIIAMIRRYEASGLQLDGKGLWLLSMVLEYACDELVIDSATFTVLFDTLLRVAVETAADTICCSMLLLLVNKFHASSTKLFQTGCDNADHLPDSIPAENFISLLNLAMVCIRHDRSCALFACKFLVSLAANVTPNHKMNYFLPTIASAFSEVFLHDSPEESANPELKREIEVYVLVLLAYFPPLYPTHASILMSHPSNLTINTVHRLSQGSLSEAGESAALLYLDSLCIDTAAKDELKTLVSIDLLRAKMNVFSPTVTEKATKLFLSLYANDIECNYRSRNSVDLRSSTSSPNLRHSMSWSQSNNNNNNGRNSVNVTASAGHRHSQGADQQQQQQQQEDALLTAFNAARSESSYSISAVTCLRDLLGIILNITETALQGNNNSTAEESSQKINLTLSSSTSAKNNAFGDYGSIHCNTSPSTNPFKSNGSKKNVLESTNTNTNTSTDASVPSISTSAAFHYMNSMVYQIGLCVHIHRIQSLHDVVARIVSLLLSQFENMPEFDLKNAKIIDTLFTLLGMRERCWLPYPMSPVDADFLLLSSPLQEHFMCVADPVVVDASLNCTAAYPLSSPSMATAPYNAYGDANYTLNAATNASNLLNNKVISYARDKILREACFLDNFLEEWELESIEVVSRKILLLYCLLQLCGLDGITNIVDLELFQEMLWDVLSDERHGIEAHPEMRRKCIQMFTLLGMQLQNPTGSSSRTSPNPSPRGSISSPNSNNNNSGRSNYSPQGTPQYNPNAIPGHTNHGTTNNNSTVSAELVSTVPLAEFAIKILCSRDNAGANDDDDIDFDIPGMFGAYSNITANTATITRDINNVTAATSATTPLTTGSAADNIAESTVTTATANKSEGGKCVSRIFRTQKHNIQLRYSCLSLVMHICSYNRSIRRKVISNYADIATNFSYLDPVRSMSPLLILVALASEYLSKVESSGEECIVTLLARCLAHPDALIRTLACETIAVIGASSPGLMHRGVCRPEIEHLLNNILLDTCVESTPTQQHTGPLVCAVLKACNALCHDVNIRPSWVPSPYTYHWSRYSMNLADRPLFTIQFLETLQCIVRTASRTYTLHYFSIVLSIVTCMMYSCNDGVFAPALPRSHPTHISDLKAALIAKFLPWMPVALDYLTSHKKIIRSMLVVPVDSVYGGGVYSNTSTALNSAQNSAQNSIANSGKDTVQHSDMMINTSLSNSNSNASTPAHSPNPHLSTIATTASTASTSTGKGMAHVSQSTRETSTTAKVSKESMFTSKSQPVSPATSAKVNAALHKNTDGRTHSGTLNSLNIMSRVKRKSNASNTVVVENVVLPDRRQDVKYSLCAEFLAEKLIEALHAFLCMDDMFPLSTYLQNASLFHTTPVIACVSYFMTECRANVKVQRRGIDFIKHFADNQIGLSSIAMHSSEAIMHAARLLHDTNEVQFAYCKIVSAVARSDDFARENFIRFNVQSLLVALILRQHVEQSRLACIAISDLCVHDLDIATICSSGVVDAVIALIDSLPNDFKIQIEAARVLVTVDQVPDMLQNIRKVSVSAILKRTKKYLQGYLKQETLPDGYEKADLEKLMQSPLWAKDPFITKFLGLFG